MANKLFGKLPNVLGQRLLVALYEAKRPMSQSEILELATKTGLMNVSANLAALHDQGLVTNASARQISLTTAGAALTSVGMEHNLFATPQELAGLVNKTEATPAIAPAPPAISVKSPVATPQVRTFNSAEEQAAQRLWEQEPSRAEANRLAESSQLTSALRHRREPQSSPPTATPPPERPSATVIPLRGGAPAASADPPPVAQPTPPVAAPTPQKPIQPVIEQAKPVEVSKPTSVPKAIAKPTPPPARRLPPIPPPPPPRFRK